MKLTRLITNQIFGISASITIALMIWLFATGITLCYSDGRGCVSSTRIGIWTGTQAWPAHFPPFSIHWDVFDNKFAWLIAEPYFQLILIGTAIYLVWFGFRQYYIRRHGGASIKANVGDI